MSNDGIFYTPASSGGTESLVSSRPVKQKTFGLGGNDELGQHPLWRGVELLAR